MGIHNPPTSTVYVGTTGTGKAYSTTVHVLYFVMVNWQTYLISKAICLTVYVASCAKCNRLQTVVLDGAKSESLPVTSLVPQGSVLGPVLCLVYSHASHVECFVGLFVDDTLRYKNVDNKNDERFLANLDALNTWSKTCKYLGVILQSDLKFTDRICDKICSARKQIWVIRRALYWAPERARLIAYKSLCLPHLEYASCARDPSTNREIKALEMVQNQDVRMIFGSKWSRGVTEAKEKLQLQQLVIRRKNTRVKLLHKILSKRGSPPFTLLLRCNHKSTPYYSVDGITVADRATLYSCHRKLFSSQFSAPDNRGF